jgi:protein-disulfide isomerase
MRHTRTTSILIGVLGGVGSAALAGEAVQRTDDVIATVAGAPITAAELEKSGAVRLFSLRTQEYQMKRQLLEEAINLRLLEQEAKKRGVVVAELLRNDVEAKVETPSESEQREYYAKNKARFGQASEADALKQIELGLRQQRLREKQAEYVKGLRERAGVRVLLSPPRLAVSAGDDPSRGPADAPVTIVEFSDFQCPFCARATPVLKQVEERYAGKVRRVFRDLPLTNIHKEAAGAAEAGTCANEQGKFWELHDALFAEQASLLPAEIKRAASKLGLDATAFAACLDSGRHRPEWQQDAAEAASYGLTGTPAFFVNGRLLSGAQPFEAFARVIDEELELLEQGKKQKTQASR